MAKLSRLIRTLLLLLGVIAAAVLAWLLWQMLQDEDETEEAVRLPAQSLEDIHIPVPLEPVDEPPEDLPASPPAPVSAPAEAAPDDLTQIDGIGPKYAAGLKQIGVTTFASLSQQDPDDLAARLKAQGLRIIGDRIRNQSWIDQAARLAAGEGSAE